MTIKKKLMHVSKSTGVGYTSCAKLKNTFVTLHSNG